MNFKEFRLGVNYWPRHRGLAMWRDWHPEEIEQEFAEMASIGLNTARIFLVWNDFQPIREHRGYLLAEPPLEVSLRTDSSQNEEVNPALVDPVMISRFDELLAIAKRHKIKLIPTLFVGWMSGTSFDVDFRQGKNIFSDPTLLKYQARYVRFFAERYCQEEAILAWDLGNEHNCFMPAESRDAAWLWTAFLCQQIKRYDKLHPVTSGMHSLGMSLAAAGEEQKFLIRDLAEELDFLNVHPYQEFMPLKNPEPPHFLRNTYIPAWQTRLYQGIGRKRVLCQEFGTLGRSMMSDRMTAKVARTVFYSLLANHDLGFLWWCHTDFTCAHEPPYEFSLMENDGLGLFTSDGKPKEVAKEFASFAKLLQEIPWGDVERQPRQAAIVTPWRSEAHISVFNAFVLAKQAGIEAEIVGPEADFSQYKLLILPSVEGPSTFKRSQWDKMLAFVEQGGVLYLSYNGCSLPQLEALFGLQVDYRWQTNKAEHVLLLSGGERLTYQGQVKAALKFRSQSAAVLGTDDEANPVLLQNGYGKGTSIFCSLPLEELLINCGPEYKTDKTFTIYQHLKKLAGLQAPVEVDHPAVELVVHRLGESKLAVFVNHGPEALNLDVLIRDKALKAMTVLNSGKVYDLEEDVSISLPGNDGLICLLQ